MCVGVGVGVCGCVGVGFGGGLDGSVPLRAREWLRGMLEAGVRVVVQAIHCYACVRAFMCANAYNMHA